MRIGYQFDDAREPAGQEADLVLDALHDGVGWILYEARHHRKGPRAWEISVLLVIEMVAWFDIYMCVCVVVCGSDNNTAGPPETKAFQH